MKKLVKVLAAAFVLVGGLLLAVSCAADDDATQEVLVGSLDIEGNYYFGGTASGEFGENMSITIAYKSNWSYDDSSSYTISSDYDHPNPPEHSYPESYRVAYKKIVETTYEVYEYSDISITGIDIISSGLSYLSYEYAPTKRTNINYYTVTIPVQVQTITTNTRTRTRRTENKIYRYVYNEYDEPVEYELLIEDFYDPDQQLTPETGEYYGTYSSTYTVALKKVGKNYYYDDLKIDSVGGNPEGSSFSLSYCYGRLNSYDFNFDVDYEKYNNNFSVPCSDLNFNRL